MMPSGQGTLSADVMASARAESIFESQANQSVPSRTMKPLTSIMEVADIEAPFPMKDANDYSSVSKHLGSSDITPFNKNISDTPLWQMYQTDPAFSKNPTNEDSVIPPKLRPRQEFIASMVKSATNRRSAKEASAYTSTPMESDEVRQVREQEEKLAKLGVTGRPKPVIPFYPAAYNPSVSVIGPDASSSMEKQQKPWPSSRVQYDRHVQDGFQHPGFEWQDHLQDYHPAPNLYGTTSIPPLSQQRPPGLPLPVAPRYHSSQPDQYRQTPSLPHRLGRSKSGSSSLKNTQYVPQARPKARRSSARRKGERPGRLSDDVIVVARDEPISELTQEPISSSASASTDGGVFIGSTNHDRKRSYSERDQDSQADSVAECDDSNGKRPHRDSDAYKEFLSRCGIRKED